MISSSLVGAANQPLMQIVATGVPIGEDWSVIGVTDDGFVWSVPGAAGVSDGSQITLVDNRYPPNRVVTYLIASASGQDTSAPITPEMSVDPRLEPPRGGAIVLSTLSGQRSVVVGVLDGSLDWNRTVASERFKVPGRPRPVTRYSATGDRQGELKLLQRAEDSEAFDAVFESGEPLLVRCTRPIFDLPPVFVIDYGDVAAVGRPGIGMRTWSVPYAVVDDPFMDQRLGAFTWDFIDSLQKVGSMVVRSGDVMEAVMSGRTWDQIDAFDWSVLA